MAMRLTGAGKLRHRVVIQQEGTATPDGGGGYTQGWTTFATVWAAVEPLTGREGLQAQALESAVTHRVTIRALSGVTAAMRLSFNGTIYNIRSVIDREERDRFMELMCETAVAT